MSSSIAFEDDFTHAHGGSCFFVTVDPNFSSDVSDVATIISRSRPEGERQAFIDQLFQQAQSAQPPQPESTEEEEEEEESPKVQESEETRQQKRKVVETLIESISQSRVEATDKEFEGLFNQLLNFVLSLFSTEQSQFSTLVLSLVDAITNSQNRTANPSLSTRYASLATLFNSLPTDPSTNHLRLTVLLKLVEFAAQNDDFIIILPVLEKLEQYLVEFSFGPGTQGEEEGNAFISRIVELLIEREQLEQARQILIRHLSTPSRVSGQSQTPSESGSKLASTLIALSLHLPNVFDFNDLVATTYPSIAHPSSSDLAKLLKIFQQGGSLSSFEQFSSKFPLSINGSSELKLERESMEKKFKLVKLAELCSDRVGETVKYEEIARALGLEKGGEDEEGEEVETWVIDAIRASLLTGRLSQPTKSLSITRALPLSQFESKHWQQIEERLKSWRKSLDQILESTKRGLSQGQVGQGQGRKGGDGSAIEVVGSGQKEEEA